MADVIANGVRHHVQRLGAGAHTVVFVHGLLIDNLSSFYLTLANPIATGAEVVLYDLRGHGMSERPATGYAVRDFVADLAALLAALRIDRPVVLVGHSFGGVVALAFAAAHPERVARLALIDAHDGSDGWAAQIVAALTPSSVPLDGKLVAAVEHWLDRHGGRRWMRLARTVDALVDGTSLTADLFASPPLPRAALASIACPVLALYGEHSDVRDRGEALAQALPACVLHLVSGCSHWILWEATAQVRERVAAFVEGAA